MNQPPRSNAFTWLLVLSLAVHVPPIALSGIYRLNGALPSEQNWPAPGLALWLWAIAIVLWSFAVIFFSLFVLTTTMDGRRRLEAGVLFTVNLVCFFAQPIWFWDIG